MRYLLTLHLLLLVTAVPAQVTITQVTGQVNLGLGIGNKPQTMFGTPIFYSADVGVTLNNTWRIMAEGGQTAFRDSDYPNQKIGFFFSSYARYQHTYYGLRLGRNVLNPAQTNQLVLSGGADYLAVVEPNVFPSGGLLGGYSFDPHRRAYLNVPVQLDYTWIPFGRAPRVSLSGRWNFNEYHAFPTISAGLIAPIYDRRMHTR